MLMRTARRLVVAVIGGTVLVLGLVMLVTPGPGIAAIVGGLAILASEFVWARLLLRRVKRRVQGAASAVGIGTRPPRSPGP